jgi:hypothetical protein
MKIFCLLITGTRNGEVYSPRIPIATNDIKKVEAALKEFADATKDEFKEEFESGDWVIEADEEGRFEACERDNYSKNQVLALIFDKNLDELDWFG